MINRKDRKVLRKRRHLRVRKKVNGTSQKPRMAVFRSEKHIYVQIIDDVKGHTLVSSSTMDPEIRGDLAKTWDKQAARKVGQAIGKKATEAGINEVVFDRGGFQYTGRIKELADGAREAGLKF
ncbi:MAG TPA: 50S ribosomal protein L18 [Thermotogota bacterium]|nr:50S ribosomal protein L18 [Thermotogota bacterium]HRW91360.1 50S ribosomal protein L18 [Thermotogota bacterium]